MVGMSGGNSIQRYDQTSLELTSVMPFSTEEISLEQTYLEPTSFGPVKYGCQVGRTAA